jgi:TonB-linked SusC/RagA family outer membrane protein
MKLTIVFLTMGFLQVSAKTLSQDVTFSGKNVPLEKIFLEVKRQTSFSFVYKANALDNAKPVTIVAEKQPLEEFLQLVFKEQPLTYFIENTTVVVEKKLVVNVSDVPSVGVDRPIGGVVIDEDGNAVSGATVTIKRTKRSIVTDGEGKFNLNIRQGDILVISFVGYEAHELRITSAITTFGDVRVTLFKSVFKLDEVQVMGYGTTTRRLGTGTISSVKADVIEKQSTGNVIGAIDGRMSGVQVVQPNGLPGAGFSVKVRGDNTLGPNFGYSSSDPLYVIDGIPQITGNRSFDTRSTVGVFGMNGGTNLLSNLNPKDILQIDVLKDADATAIYGARGANGVVLITTKKGQAGRIRLNIDLSAGSGKIPHFVPVLNTPQYLELRKEAFANEGITPDENNAPDLVSWDQKLNNDFQRIIYGGTAKQSNANITISGGNENVKYYAGLNYRKEGTVVLGNYFVRRIGGLINLDATSLNRKFNASFSVNYSNEESDIPSVSFPSLLVAPPNYDPYNKDGSFNWNAEFTNPIAALLSKYEAVKTLLNSNMTLSYKPAKGVTLKILSSYSLSRADNSVQSPGASSNPFFGPQVGSATFAQSPTSSYTVEPQAVYEFNIKRNRFTALAGGTLSSAVSESTILYGTNYSYESQLNTIAAAGQVFTSYLYDKYNYASGFARLSYDLNHKYLLKLNYRKDASSRFGTNNKLAGFASVGAAWVFSSEKAIKQILPFLSFGKIKLSYGSTGNDRVDNYLYELYYSPYYTSYYSPAYQGVNTLGPGVAANPALAWEITKKAEISLDLGFFQDKILFRGNIYRNRSSNIINAEILSGQAGTTFINRNVDALVQNRGLELELITRNMQKKNFSWITNFNISFERNKLVRFNNINNTSASGLYVIGAPINAFLEYYKYSYAGPNPVNGAPTYRDVDGNLGADKYVVGLGTPYYGGLTNTISYRNFTLDIFVKFQNRRGKLNDVLVQRPFGSMTNQNISALNRYQLGKNNDNAIWPLAVSGSGPLTSTYSNFYRSDFAYGNIGFLKVKNVSLSYDVAGAWIGKAGIQSLRLYLQCQNLFTLAKQKYVMDPEMPGFYPSLRTIVFGINCAL